MEKKAKEILLKQMELLHEESQKRKGEMDYPRELADMSRAMAEIAKIVFGLEDDPYENYEEF